METETQEEFIRPISKPRVNLKRNTKGVFWDISVYGDDIDEAKRETIRIDKELLEEYAEVNKTKTKPKEEIS